MWRAAGLTAALVLSGLLIMGRPAAAADGTRHKAWRGDGQDGRYHARQHRDNWDRASAHEGRGRVERRGSRHWRGHHGAAHFNRERAGHRGHGGQWAHRDGYHGRAFAKGAKSHEGRWSNHWREHSNPGRLGNRHVAARQHQGRWPHHRAHHGHAWAHSRAHHSHADRSWGHHTL